MQDPPDRRPGPLTDVLELSAALEQLSRVSTFPHVNGDRAERLRRTLVDYLNGAMGEVLGDLDRTEKSRRAVVDAQFDALRQEHHAQVTSLTEELGRERQAHAEALQEIQRLQALVPARAGQPIPPAAGEGGAAPAAGSGS